MRTKESILFELKKFRRLNDSDVDAVIQYLDKAKDNDLTERAFVYGQAVVKYGIDAQIVVCIEELAELQKELCKALRSNCNSENLIDELADVQIMVEQMRLLFDSENNAVGDRIKFKIERLKKRLEG